MQLVIIEKVHALYETMFQTMDGFQIKRPFSQFSGFYICLMRSCLVAFSFLSLQSFINSGTILSLISAVPFNQFPSWSKYMCEDKDNNWYAICWLTRAVSEGFLMFADWHGQLVRALWCLLIDERSWWGLSDVGDWSSTVETMSRIISD